MLKSRGALGLLIMVLAHCACVSAQEHGGQSGAGHEAHGANIEFEPHHTVGLFVGDSREDTREENREGGTLALEYEYRFTERYGIGVTWERVFGEFDENLLVIPFAMHQGPWKFYAGPGFEDATGEREMTLRLGVEYGFHVGDVEISPQFDVDFVDGEEVFVIGVVFAVEL